MRDTVFPAVCDPIICWDVSPNLGGEPLAKPVIKFTGFRKIDFPKPIKCGRRIPILKYALLVAAGYVWDIDYNNARAAGRSPAAAGAIATAKAADPGVEMAWDFGWSIGTYLSPFD